MFVFYLLILNEINTSLAQFQRDFHRHFKSNELPTHEIIQPFKELVS